LLTGPVDVPEPAERIIGSHQILIGRGVDLQRQIPAEVIGIELVLGAVVRAGVEVARGAGLHAVAPHLHIPEQRLAEGLRRTSTDEGA
jgi:hypothetical protein